MTYTELYLPSSCTSFSLCCHSIYGLSVTATSEGCVPFLRRGPSPWLNALCLLTVGILEAIWLFSWVIKYLYNSHFLILQDSSDTVVCWVFEVCMYGFRLLSVVLLCFQGVLFPFFTLCVFSLFLLSCWNTDFLFFKSDQLRDWRCFAFSTCANCSLVCFVYCFCRPDLP